MNFSEVNVTLNSKDGLHARPAGILAKTASQYQSKIDLLVNGVCKNAKSIMSIMSLGLKGGESITIKAEGDDANQALKEIKELFDTDFRV